MKQHPDLILKWRFAQSDDFPFVIEIPILHKFKFVKERKRAAR